MSKLNLNFLAPVRSNFSYSRRRSIIFEHNGISGKHFLALIGTFGLDCIKLSFLQVRSGNCQTYFNIFLCLQNRPCACQSKDRAYASFADEEKRE